MKRTCPICKGKGFETLITNLHLKDKDVNFKPIQKQVPCYKCKGTGVLKK